MQHETRVAYGETIGELMKENKNIVVFDADLSKATKTSEAKKVCPERHFNAGIAECNMLGMAAGMAASGKIAFASSFAIFTAGRAFEIIRNSIAYPKLNVKICATHAGISVGEDGASHQAIEDIAIMRSIPNMKVFVASDYYQTKALIKYVANIDGPCYVRLQRGKSDDLYNENSTFDFEKINILKKGSDVALIATGLMTQAAIKASEELEKDGISTSVIEVVSIKPIDESGIKDVISNHKYNFTIEEHNIIGGLFGAVSEVAILNPTNPVYPIGVNDTFGESGKMNDVLNKYGLTASNIVSVVKEKIK